MSLTAAQARKIVLSFDGVSEKRALGSDTAFHVGGKFLVQIRTHEPDADAEDGVLRGARHADRIRSADFLHHRSLQELQRLPRPPLRAGRENPARAFEAATTGIVCYYAVRIEGDSFMRKCLGIAVALCCASLAGCGQRDELSCDSGRTTDAVISVVKDNQPIRLLAAASSELIQKRQEQLKTQEQSGRDRCNSIADQNWVRSFNADFPWYEPQPKSQSEDANICEHLHEKYMRDNTVGIGIDAHNNQVDSDAAGIENKCLELSGENGQQNWDACDISARKLIAQDQKSIDEVTKSAYSTAVYSLNTIRLENKDETTGAVKCEARLHATIPDFGAAEEDISYKVEKTTDGQLYATLEGLE
jgi:hypothetical protein